METELAIVEAFVRERDQRRADWWAEMLPVIAKATEEAFNKEIPDA